MQNNKFNSYYDNIIAAFAALTNEDHKAMFAESVNTLRQWYTTDIPNIKAEFDDDIAANKSLDTINKHVSDITNMVDYVADVYDQAVNTMNTLLSAPKTLPTIIEYGKTVTPRILCRVGRPLENDSKELQMLAESYKLINKDASIHVPIVNYKVNGNDDTIHIDINTLNDDKDNAVYIYVAKADKTLGHYNPILRAGDNSKTKNKLYAVTVDYDGNESKKTPVALKRRFD